MSGFILTAIAVAIVVGVCRMLSPDGATKKYLGFVGSLCLICALVSPVAGAIASWNTGFDGMFSSVDTEGELYDEIYKSALVNGAKSNAEALICESLLTQFNLPDQSLRVTLNISSDGDVYSVESVKVTLMSSALFADPRDISEYINQELGCPCFVEYE